jgi:transcriptional regulator with XRE-family HTH domain
MTQSQLASEAEMKQARVSALERVGDASFSIETLVRIAAAFRVGLVVKFVSMSDMLSWENEFAPDRFEVVPVEDDATFRKPTDRLTPKPSALSDGLSKALSGERSEQIPPDAFSPSMNYAHSSVWPDADSALEGFSANSLRLLECDQNSSTIAGAAATTNLYQRGNAA